MIKKRFFLIFFIYLILFVSDIAFAQQNFSNGSENKKQSDMVLTIFNRIESGISTGSVSEISNYLNTQTYLSLSSGVSGYYSSNQAFYILEDFFNLYKATSFHFQNVQTKENMPYATGVYNYFFRGKRDSSNVYISLKLVGDSWKITQITIN
jgi:hypothetical protein